MLCSNCKSDLPKEALFCSSCGNRQVLSTITAHPVSLPDSHQLFWRQLQVQEIKHQEALTQFRDELHKQNYRVNELTHKLHTLEQQQSQEDATEGPDLVKLSTRAKIIITLFLLSLGGGLIWLLVELYRNFFTHRSEDLLLGSATLTILGTLYLAYDLLGRRRGFLQWLTLFTSYWLIGVLIFEPIFLLATYVVLLLNASQPQEGLKTILGLTLFAGLISACTSMLIGIPNSIPGRQGFSWRGVVTGGLLWWLLCTLTIIFILLIYRTFQTRYADLFPTPVLIIGGAIIGGFRYHLAGPVEPVDSKVSLFSKKGCLTGMVAGVGMMLSLYFYFLSVQIILSIPLTVSNAVTIPLIISGASVLIGGIAGTFARYIYWRAINLRKNVLGAFGLFLIFLAIILQTIDPLLHIYQGQ